MGKPFPWSLPNSTAGSRSTLARPEQDAEFMALLDLYTEWLTKRITNRWFPEWNNAHQGVLRLSDRLNGYLAMQQLRLPRMRPACRRAMSTSISNPEPPT
jgi:hypothetical protein